MNKILLSISIVFIFNIQFTLSQSRLDSLNEAMSKATDDREKVDILNFLSLESTTPDSLLIASLELSKEINYKDGLINAQDILSNRLTDEGKYDSALELKLMNLNHQLKTSPTINLASTYSGLGLIYDYKGDYENAMTYFLEGMKISEELGNKEFISNFHNRIGIIYNYQGEYNKTLEHFNKSLKLREELGDKSGQAEIYNNIGIIYRKKNDIDKAIEYYIMSLDLKKELNDPTNIASSYNNIGAAYFYKNEYSTALDYYNESLALKLKENLTSDIASTYINIGETQTYLKNYNSALLNIKKGLSLSMELGNLDDIKLSYEELAQTYAELNDYNSAYKYHILFSGLKDSIFNKESDERLIDMQTKYDVEKKEQEISLLQKENQIKRIETKNSNLIRNVFIVAFVIISFLIIAIIRSYREDLLKNKQLSSSKVKIESQNEILKSMSYEKDQLMKIVAHDLRSPLNQIDGLINIATYDSNNLNDEQRDALSSVAIATKHSRELISKVLTTKSVDNSKLKVELRNVDINELLQTTIHDQEVNVKRKKIEIHLESKSDNPSAYVDISYTEQIFENLISNAVKFSPHDRQIYIVITDNVDLLRVEIRDEGPGFTEDDKKLLFGVYNTLSATPTGGETSTGLGLSIVKKYVEIVNGKVWCESVVGQGASFFVELNKSNIQV